MAIVLMTVIQRWNGLSTDTKPSSGVSEGSEFHCIDTGEEYIYHNKMWECDLRLTCALKSV